MQMRPGVAGARRVVATVEARMSSTRLPGKVLRPILGRPMLELLLERLRRAKSVTDVVIATTTNLADDAIAALARRLQVRVFRGSEDDVLDRVLRTARSAQADVIVEITGDCPLVDPEVVDRLATFYLANNYDYVSNCLRKTFPDGFDTQVFSAALLDKVAGLTRNARDREHVSVYIYEHPEMFSLHNVESGLPPYCADMWLSVDTAVDFEVVSTIFEALYPQNPAFSVADVVHFLERRPDLATKNRR
jgi:spore coat polysaccharide biosynthesis protein SpsF